MWKALLCTVMLASGIFAEGIELKTPEGTIKIEISDEKQYIESERRLSSSSIIWNIEQKLNLLDTKYLTKLHGADQIEARLLLHNIRFLIRLLPLDYYIWIEPYLPLIPIPMLDIMASGDFAVLIERLQDEVFSDNQMSMLKTAAKGNYFSIDQLCRILDVFDFEDDMLEAVRIVYPRIVDTKNAFKLYDRFEFPDSKEKLEEILR